MLVSCTSIALYSTFAVKAGVKKIVKEGMVPQRYTVLFTIQLYSLCSKQRGYIYNQSFFLSLVGWERKIRCDEY